MSAETMEEFEGLEILQRDHEIKTQPIAAHIVRRLVAKHLVLKVHVVMEAGLGEIRPVGHCLNLTVHRNVHLRGNRPPFPEANGLRAHR